MGSALTPYDESERTRQRPVSFEVAPHVSKSHSLSLPLQPRTSQGSIVYPSSAPRREPTSLQLQPQRQAHRAATLNHQAALQTSWPAQTRSSLSRTQPRSTHLKPQLKVTSSVVPVSDPVQLPEPRRGVVKPLPLSRLQPRWLVSLRIAQQCSAFLATGLVAAALVAYGTTVYAQQQWGSQYGELTQAEKERSLMDAFGESLKQNYAEQASQPGSPLSGRPTPYYKIPIEPQTVRPAIEVPPDDPSANRPQNFPKGY